MHYCLLYLKIYQTSCTFEINVTDRYPSKTTEPDEDAENDDKEDDAKEQFTPHLEGCVVAKQNISKGEHIEFLEGWLASLDDDVDQTFQGETDFSIIHTSRNGNANLLLGPARFVNHDCNPNCSFTRKGQKISLRAIKNIHVGQELTVTYAKNYFGYRNRECRCVTCEIRGVNGFGTLSSYPSEEDSSDTDYLTKLKRRNRKNLRNNAELAHDSDALSPAVLAQTAEPAESESTPQSSRSPSADTPATSIEPDLTDTKVEKDIPLKRRLRQREGYYDSEDKLFKFSFDDDDDNFTTTREEWKSIGRSLSKEDRELYTFHDYVFEKLSELKRYKDLQRFYFSSPIDADLDLTLDCVNCGTPFFGPDDRVAPRRLPTRMCPRCHRHAIIFNAYWPSTEALEEKIVLLRAWDFTSLKDIGVRGEFIPPEEKKKKQSTQDLSDDSESSSESDSEYDTDSEVLVRQRHRYYELEPYDSDSDAPTKYRKNSKRESTTLVQSRGRGRPKKFVEVEEKTVVTTSRSSRRRGKEESEDELTPAGTRTSLVPRRPLYVVPLNSKMPTCILLPPKEDKHNSLGFPLPMPLDKSRSGSEAGAPQQQPQEPKRLLRGKVDLHEYETGKSMYDFPFMTTPSLPSSSPLLIDGYEPFNVDDPAPPPPPSSSSHKHHKKLHKHRVGGCGHPKVKTYGLNRNEQADMYTVPSWKLLQNIQPYR